jgi:hypothetical protein
MISTAFHRIAPYCGFALLHEKQTPLWRGGRLYVRAVKGAGVWRSLERSGNP